MFYQMQEIAWEHAQLLGFGYKKLRDQNQFWVLSRLHMEIERRPKWTEEFTLETWSRGTDGFYGYRDFQFIDNTGKAIIRATSSWLILSSDTKKIVRLSGFSEFPAYSESMFGTNVNKIPSPASDDPLTFTPVLFNEIDINQHFNTGRYIERIIDGYNFEFHESHELATLEVNFLKEGLPSDRLAVKKERLNEQQHLCSVVRETDGADLIRARLTWKGKA